MSNQYFSFETVGKFSANDVAYAKKDNGLEKFYKFRPDFDHLIRVLEARKDHPVDRDLLVEEIIRQYESMTTDQEIFKKIEKLKDENTFTIITAHQPNLLTGPLYFIYKCLSAIKVSEKLMAKHKGIHVQPVMVLGGEDHDFEELNHLSLFGKKVVWEDHQGGAVGRYSTESLQPVLEQVYEILGESENARILTQKIRDSFWDKTSYGAAMQHFVHNLIGHLGILIVQMDNPAFKQKMIPTFRDDLLNHTSFDVVRKVQTEFIKAGYDEQAYVRPINIFYFDQNARWRIEENNGKYFTPEGNKEWTKEEILDEINQHPERFSPNVVLRPIYQEIIFPNLAYVGGGGEISYWLERKSQFEALDVFYPMLIRRDSFQLLSEKDLNTLHEWNLTLEDLLKPEHRIIDQYLRIHGRDEISLKEEIEQLEQLEKSIQEKAEVIDHTLVPRIGAQFAKFKNDLHGVEKRLKRSEKQNHDRNLNRLKRIIEKLFPNNGLQERSDNFMSWYILHGEGFFRMLLEHADPFDTRMKTLIV